MGDIKEKTYRANDRIWMASFTAQATEDVLRLVIHSQETDADSKKVINGHTDTVSVRVDDPAFVHAWVEAGGEAAQIATTLEFIKQVAYLVRGKARAVEQPETLAPAAIDEWADK